MKIRMTAISAGPDGFLDVDRVVEVPDAKALELIDTRHAIPAGPDEKVTGRWPHGFELSAAAKPPRK